MDDLARKIEKGFAGRRVCVVGDPVADQFLRGTIDRVSREAPVFILRHDETETLPGGAANAAANIASLGAEAILIGVIGDDPNGEELVEALRAAGVPDRHLLVTDERPTTTKVRVLAGQHYAPRQQVIRIDYGVSPAFSEHLQSRVIEQIEAVSADADAIIISDYSCGTVSPEVGLACAAAAGGLGIPLLVDSRSRLEIFEGATSATPNSEEVEQILGVGFTEADCERLRERLDLGSLLVTRGNKGMLLIEKGSKPLEIQAVGPTEPVDVTGAGDTVIAAYALGIVSGLNFADAARVANHAGGIVVMKRGTGCVSFEELIESLKEKANADPAVRTAS